LPEWRFIAAGAPALFGGSKPAFSDIPLTGTSLIASRVPH
jgi:hypothetical protein